MAEASENRNELSSAGTRDVVQAHTVHGNVIQGGVHIHPTGQGHVIPQQLPAAPAGFVGRSEELAMLADVLDAPDEALGTVVISAIGGAGGIGKTWLALQWSNRNRDRFPDGQLFVDLHGFSPGSEPVEPAAALQTLLDGLDVAPAAMPASLEAKVGRYRSLVAGRRMLILLDNAKDVTQIRPLLPGSPTCTVLITSRDRLTGLITAHGARSLPVDALSPTDARKLLAARFGAERLEAEPQAVDELTSQCAGLPLALSIVADRATSHPEFPLKVLARELRDAGTRLGALDDGDPLASVRTVLSCSYRALGPQHAQVFGLVGLAPGPDISVGAAANLAELAPGQAGVILRALERVSLVQQRVPGRYQMHDLIRLYSVETGRGISEDRRDAALRRLVGFYIHSAHSGERLLGWHRDSIKLAEPAVSLKTQQAPFSESGAWEWFESEHACLMATQQEAFGRGWNREAWQLAWALDTFQYRRGYLHDQLKVWQTGLVAAQRLEESALEVRAQRRLGRAFSRLGRHAEALDSLFGALNRAKGSGDRHSQAHTHRALAWALGHQGEEQRALEHATHALALYEELNEPVREARALNAVVWYSIRLGKYDHSRADSEAALGLCRRYGDREAEASALGNLGYLENSDGKPDRALRYYQQALALCLELGHEYIRADTLVGLGHSYVSLGYFDRARDSWYQALGLYQNQHRSRDAVHLERLIDKFHLNHNRSRSVRGHFF